MHEHLFLCCLLFGLHNWHYPLSGDLTQVRLRETYRHFVSLFSELGLAVGPVLLATYCKPTAFLQALLLKYFPKISPTSRSDTGYKNNVVFAKSSHTYFSLRLASDSLIPIIWYH